MNRQIKNARKLVHLTTLRQLETNAEMIAYLDTQILETQKKIAGVK
jgi:hypothetical protein